jgi:hypothetical protein
MSLVDIHVVGHSRSRLLVKVHYMSLVLFTLKVLYKSRRSAIVVLGSLVGGHIVIHT